MEFLNKSFRDELQSSFGDRSLIQGHFKPFEIEGLRIKSDEFAKNGEEFDKEIVKADGVL